MDLITFSISSHVLEQFIIYGIIANVVSTIILSLVMVSMISIMPSEDRDEFLSFFKARSYHISQSDKTKVMLNSLLILLPMHKVFIHIVMYFSMLRDPGLLGLFRAVRRADEFSIIQLVTYTDLNNK